MHNKKKLAMGTSRYKSPQITQEVVADIKRFPQLYRGHVKTSIGSVYTKEEFETRSKHILAMKLP